MIFSGCSITWGDELENREEDRFSKIVADTIGVPENNISLCGISNDAIVRRVVSSQPIQPIVLQLTVPSRIEYFTKDGPQKFSLQRQMKIVSYRRQMRSYYGEVNNEQHQMENLFKNVFIFEQFCYLNNLKHIILFADCDIELHRGHWSSLCRSKITCIWKDILGYKHRGGHPNKEEHSKIADYLLKVI
tara:strand:+ start:258 stop:824 length:567 start_codon:yes stop_codon:yes gene_type:complete